MFAFNACCMQHPHASWFAVTFAPCHACRRFNNSAKYLQPLDPEKGPTLPIAEEVWKWLDKAIASIKRMLRHDAEERQVCMHMRCAMDHCMMLHERPMRCVDACSGV